MRLILRTAWDRKAQKQKGENMQKLDQIEAATVKELEAGS